MDPTLIYFIGGLFVGAVFTFLWIRSKATQAFAAGRNESRQQEAILLERLDQKEIQLASLKQEILGRDAKVEALQKESLLLKSQQIESVTQLQEKIKHFNEKTALLENLHQKFSESFKALSSDALKNNNTSFLELARATLEKYQAEAKGELEKRASDFQAAVRPVKESLEKVDIKIQELEKARVGAYEALSHQVRSLLETQHHLRGETANLVRALRSPTVRGRWGEMQLKRVVEIAGMLEHCDFYEQQSVTDDEGGRLRPDLIVKLPGNKTIVVDAKAVLSAYLDAQEQNTEEMRREKLRLHAHHIRSHMSQLSKKSYWEQFQPAPEFVVLFLPGEPFFSAALEMEPSLIEAGVTQRVILATPTTLIALLRAVAYGWRQESLAQNAQVISELGKDLYKRISDLSGHFFKLGRHLSASVDSYNKAVGTLETRVLSTARRFKELGSIAQDTEVLEEIPAIDQMTRQLQSEEFRPPASYE